MAEEVRVRFPPSPGHRAAAGRTDSRTVLAGRAAGTDRIAAAVPAPPPALAGFGSCARAVSDRDRRDGLRHGAPLPGCPQRPRQLPATIRQRIPSQRGALDSQHRPGRLAGTGLDGQLRWLSVGDTIRLLGSDHDWTIVGFTHDTTFQSAPVVTLDGQALGQHGPTSLSPAVSAVVFKADPSKIGRASCRERV